MSEGATAAHSGRDKAAEYGVVIALREITLRLDLVVAEFAARNGLHATDLRAIIALLDAERANLTATPTWLAKQLRLNSASVTALIDRLERAGHAQRHRESADRRVISLTVTGRAKRLGEQFFGPLIEQLMAIMDNYGPHDRDVIMRFLAEIADAIPASTGAAP